MDIFKNTSSTIGEKIIEEINDVIDKKTGAQYSDDEIARKTEWKGIAGGGANFTIHRVHQKNPMKLMLKPASWSYLFPTIFAGAGLLSAFVLAPFLAEKFGMIAYLLAAVFTLPFIAGGVGIFIYLTTPCTIDKESGYFWIGRNNRAKMEDPGNRKQAPLDEIHAIQLIEQTTHRSYSQSSSNRSTTSYKLIFVLKDASRIYVTGSGQAKTTRAIADKISKFLDIPVWDAI